MTFLADLQFNAYAQIHLLCSWGLCFAKFIPLIEYGILRENLQSHLWLRYLVKMLFVIISDEYINGIVYLIVNPILKVKKDRNKTIMFKVPIKS